MSSQKIEHLESELQNSTDEKRVDLLNKIGVQIYRTNLQKTKQYATEALELSQRLNYQKGLADSYRTFGIYFYANNSFDEAIDYYTRALKISENIDDEKGIAITCNMLGGIYYNKSDYKTSLQYHFESLRIREKLQEKHGLAASYNNIAAIYHNIKEERKALEFQLKALHILKELDEKLTLASSYNNLGIIYHKLQQNEKSLENYFKALDLLETDQDKTIIAMTYNNIGVVYEDKNEYEKALSYYHKSLELKKKLKNIQSLVNSYGNIGEIYLIQKKYEKARIHLEKAQEYATDVGAKDELQQIYENLSKLYEEQGDYKKALSYHKQYVKLTQEIFNTKKSEKIAEIQTKYEIEQREKEAEIYRLKNIQLVNLNKELQEANAVKDKFFTIIAHDLKNPFSIILGTAEFLSRNYSELDDKETQLLIDKIYNSAADVNTLLKNLLDWSSAETGRLEFKPERIHVSEIVDKIIKLLKLGADEKNITITNKTIDTHFIYADRNTLKTVLRNLLSNAIKFTHPQGTINICSTKKENTIQISVIDNGIGIPEKNMKSLFQMDRNKSTIGTSGERGTGLGLVLCKDFVEKNNGEIWVESKTGQGSTFSFSLPIDNPMKC